MKKKKVAKAAKAATKKPSARRAAAIKSSTTSKTDGVDLDMIERLSALMSENDLVEIEVVSGPDRMVRLSRRSSEAVPMGYLAAPNAAGPAADGLSAGGAASPAGSAKDDRTIEFTSPMVGTFYRAASPESPPYVNTGDKVERDSVLCIIEAMKVMNEIKSESKGEVVDILVENGEAVEFGQPLFLIRKA